jgi:hypothetical protein
MIGAKNYRDGLEASLVMNTNAMALGTQAG